MQIRIILTVFLALSFTFPAKGVTPYEAEREIFLANPEAQRSSGMASSLLAMSVAALGSVMLTTCRPRIGFNLAPSLVAFSNASSAYIMSEIISANIHKQDISARNESVQRLAAQMRERGGGEVQKTAFDESKNEREYLLNFVGMRREWISALILGFMTAGQIAGDEDNIPENQVICTGTLEAAIPVAESLGLAYKAEIGQGPDATVATYLTGVLGFVADQILPMVENPSTRITMSNLAADASIAMLGELSGLGTIIEGNIADLNLQIAEFISSNGVESNTGLTNQAPLPTGESQDAGTTTTSTSTSTSTSNSSSTTSPSTSGSASVTQISATGSSAANITVKTCTERSPDGKSLVFKSTCSKPATFPSVALKRGSLTTKSAAAALSKFANALALGDIEVAKLEASNLNALAARIISGKKEILKSVNLARLQTGKPMIDLDSETKKAIERMTTGIKAEVTKRGGEKLLLASSPQRPLPPPAIKTATEEDFVADLPPRLRWKKYHRNAVPSEVQKTPVQETPVPEKELSLWERLTNRYHTRFLNQP